MSELDRRQPVGQLDVADQLLTALDTATSPGEVRLIFDRAEALVDAAKRARVADEQLRQYVAVSLKAQRRGGELLKATPRSKGRPWHGLPTIAELMGLPANKAHHIAENWIAVAEVPEHLFDDYLAREDAMPTRAGLLRFRSHRPKRTPGRPRADGTPPNLRSVPDSSTRSRVEHPANGRPLPDRLAPIRAEGWQACVEWLAQQSGKDRVPDRVLRAAEAANPYAP